MLVISCLVAGEVNIGQVLFHDFNANLLMCFQLKLIAKWFFEINFKGNHHFKKCEQEFSWSD